MKEIGCHFSFESIYGNPYHATDLLFSSGRNCLRYILREKHITTLFLPYFLCESLSEVSSFEGVQIKYYHVDQNLFPEGSDGRTHRGGSFSSCQKDLSCRASR